MSDVEVSAEDLLTRRIPHHQVRNGRIMSGAFKTRELSVDLAKLRDPPASQAEDPTAGLVQFPAEVPLKDQLSVTHDPIPHDNASHALVTGKITAGKAKRMRDACNLLATPGQLVHECVPVVGLIMALMRFARSSPT